MSVNFSSPGLSSPPTPDFQRDIRLLADVCGEYVTHTDSGWQNSVAEHPDLESLVVAADRHGVLPLFARALSRVGILCEIAQARAREIAVRNLALTAELVKLIRALRELDIQTLAYKGPILGQQLYGDVTVRQCLDLDIMLAPADVLRTRDALCQLGYQDTEQFSRPLLRKHVSSQCEWQMEGIQSGTIVELHWAPFPHYASFDLSVEELNRSTVTIEVAGERVRALDPRYLSLVLSTHGTKHFWCRLGWVVDFALVLQDYTETDAEKLLDDAAGRGMKRILLISAALTSNVLRLRLPEALESALSADAWARVLTDTMLQALLTGILPDDLLSENLLLLRSRERWFDRVKIVSRLAFTPGPEEWRLVSLPEWAEWLYQPIRTARAARYLPQIARRAFSSRKL